MYWPKPVQQPRREKRCNFRHNPVADARAVRGVLSAVDLKGGKRSKKKSAKISPKCAFRTYIVLLMRP